MAKVHTPASGTDIADALFSQLLEFRWRDVSFPATSFETSLRHDLAEHKFPDHDGADIESTGLAPVEIAARIPFRNGVIPARSESFGILYPTQFRRFITAMADKSTGTLQHPEFGSILCKPVSCKVVWAAEPRDGVDVDVQWLQTIDSATAAEFFSESPVQTATLGALDLDSNIGTLGPVLPQTPEFKPTFADTMRSIQAIGDTVTLLAHRGAGVINSLQYRIDAIEESVRRAEKAGDVTLWALRQAAGRMRSGLEGLRETLLQSKGRRIGLYPVRKVMTLAGVAAAIPTAVTDLMNLNPALLRNPVVLPGQIVRYYAS